VVLLPSSLFAEGATNVESRLTIPDGTPVQLRVTQTVSSVHAHAGDPLNFVVENDVRVDDRTVIRAGSTAHGSVLAVKHRRILGIGGKVVYGIDSVALVTGETIGLHARKVVKGTPHTWRMVAGIAVTALFYLPAAPIFLLTRGGDSTLLKGTEVTARIDCATSVHSTGLPQTAEAPAGLNDMLANLPPRVMNREGREGDMVNLVFVAQKNDLQAAFARAGWVKTDAFRPMMAWHLFTQRLHDARLPMARFYMFGRVQDYSYALPDPEAVMSRRHHIRIWETQYTVDGAPVWAAAATYDQAIEFAKHGHIINHTIDPQVDTERDFVGTDIAETSQLRKAYLQSANPVFEAQTTSGQAYQSDSRILLLDLRRTDVAQASTRAAADQTASATALQSSSNSASR
jgi:LssY-like putative type I secretion system component LssY